MSFPTNLSDLFVRGAAAAARSGLYPNGHYPGGFRFDDPAGVTARTSTSQGTTNPTHPSAVTNSNSGSQSNEQADVSSSEGSGNTNTTGASGGNGTANHTNTSAAQSTGDSDGNNGISAEERTNGESDLGLSVDDTGEDDDAESISTLELPSESPAQKPRKRKHQSVAESKIAAPRKAHPEAAARKPKSAKVKPEKAKGSAQTLKYDRFATRAYVYSKALRPPNPLFKHPKSTDESEKAIGTPTEIPFDVRELLDLVGILGALTPSLHQTFFDTLEDSASIDKKIIIGLKLNKDEEDDDDAEGHAKRPKPRGNGDELLIYTGLNTNLPPLNNINDIFADLTQSAVNEGLSDFLEAFGSGALKVSTLCSGTESPLLALQMVQDSLKTQKGYNFQVEHQFSCEIEPFKQAYIQRNFKPAVLFRDVVELKHKEAHTAFGAQALVPDYADIMIAGSSCVDYSTLNNQQKEFGANGESYETLVATVDYAENHKPTIVILENVYTFPWPQVETMWHNVGYATKVAYLDSKDFYLPQTRQRGYMIGLRRNMIKERKVGLDADVAVERWFEVLEKLQRRASSPFTEFIFADDDEELRKYNQQAAVLLPPNKSVSWEKTRIECLSCRSCNFLGFKKPVTDWENNGSCLVPDFCNAPWFKKQVERIWDTIDINHLRAIGQRSYDMAYKCRCVDLSQSCIRERDPKPWGIVGCITATANPYLTHRGGPLVGAEALSLQGLPRERLILNRESSKQLVDLTGNAMTTTVVGSAILAALITCGEVLVPPSEQQTEPLSSPTASSRPMSPIEYDSSWLLTEMDLTTDRRLPMTVAEIRVQASKSIRLCSCEGLILSTTKGFKKCLRCGHTSCVDCGKKPQHQYVEINPLLDIKGTSALDFEERIRQALPPRLVISGLLAAYAKAATMGQAQFGEDHTEAIKAAAAEECQLVSVKRDRGWSVTYESRRSRLVLTCERKWDGHVLCSEDIDNLASAVAVQWKFYARPKAELPANSQIRKDLLHPVARLNCSKSLFDGQWEVRSPERHSFTLEVLGEGDTVPSWEKNQGLEDPIFKNRFVWSVLEFRLPAGSSTPAETIPGNILGKYDLLQHCGTACGSLHVRQKASVTDSEDPVFLFLESTPLENASHDYFVFAQQHHRLQVTEVREVLAKVHTGWRPSDTDQISQVTCEVPNRWIPVGGIRLEEYAPRDLQKVHLATADLALRVNSSWCNSSGLPVIWCEFAMTKEISEDLGRDARKSFQLVKNRFSLEHLSWLMKTTGHALEFTDWQSLSVTDDLASRCTMCAPASPSVAWKEVRHKKGHQIRPFEDMKEACDYERNVKAAPEAATAELSYHEHSALAALKIDFNVLTLVHKAIAALSESRGCLVVPSTVHWRAVVDHCHDYPVPFPPIQLKDCQSDKAAAQPPSFDEEKLQPHQLKSFGWMIDREEDQDQSWDEQEIIEAQVAPMNLRLEARVTARRRVMGGVLADDVGYGKTALVLAIIDHHFRNTKLVSSPSFKIGVDDMITLKATLILVPTNLTKQWKVEITKFLGDTYQILVLTKSDFLKCSTVSEFRNADIILASWDLFDDEYFKALAHMSRAYHTPVSAGRGFEEWFQTAQGDLKTLVKNSDGLDPDRLSSAWEGLKDERDKYKKFFELSKRNKKGSETPTEAGEEPPLKQARLEDLNADDTEMEAPTEAFLPLHGCIFQRLVVDEFTYVDAKQLPLIMGLQADRRWILSGTPSHNTFAGVSSMAKLIGTTIGLADDAELRYQKVKGGTSEVSGGEALRSYATFHSPSWHKARNEKAVAFIDRFVRKNTAFVEGVWKHHHYRKVKLPSPQRALYHEGYLMLVNQGVKMGQKETSTKTDKDAEPTRTDQIVNHMSTSQSPEDALITFSSMVPKFAIETSSVAPWQGPLAEKANLIIAKVRNMTLELRGAFWIMARYEDKIEDVPDIYQYLRSVQENRFGDATVRALLDLVFAQAKETMKWTVADGMKHKKPKGGASEDIKLQYAMRKNSAAEPLGLSKQSRTDDLKLRADSLTSRTIDLIGVVREWRYFVGEKKCLSKRKIECASCGRRSKNYSKMLFMGRCGHAGCERCCSNQNGSLELLSHCLDQRCGSRTAVSTVFEASELAISVSSELVRRHGSKMVAITDLLSQIPKAEKTLIFVQFPRIVTALKAILTALGIDFADTDIRQASAEVQRFKDIPSCRVCVLQLDSVNAAGWNLQNANHIIFVSSLVARTQHDYNSSMTQAIGRAFRLGQTKDVHIYQFMAERTIDVNVLEERTGAVVVERGGACLLVNQKQAGDRDGLGGLPFSGAVYGAEEDGA